MYTIRMFFRSEAAIDLREIIETAEDGQFADDDPKFDPNPLAAGKEMSDWKSASMIWASGKDPIVFRNHFQDDECKRQVQALSTILSRSRKSKAADQVAEHLKHTVRMLEIEVNREQLVEAVWVMLDAIEAKLAKKYDGIVFTLEGIIFDKNLKKVYKL